MSAAPSIRVATAADVDGILALWQRAESAPSVTDTNEDVRRVVSLPQACVLVAVDGGAIVGSLITTFDGWRANVYRMAVDPRYRRHGLALALVVEGEAWLRSMGAKRISALVEGHRDSAQAFWTAAGFAHYDGMRRYVKSV